MDMSIIEGLAALCAKQPVSLEKIRAFITNHAMDPESITRAAIKLCQHGAYSYGDFVYMHGREPAPEELPTYNWEGIFDLLIEKGLDPDLIIHEDEEDQNILQELQEFDDFDLGARVLRKILLRRGSPNIVVDGISLFEEVDFDLVQDISLGLFESRWQPDSTFRKWLVLMGFGGLLKGGRCPVHMAEGYTTRIFIEYEKFDYRIRYTKDDWTMSIFYKDSGIVVATL